MRLWWQAVEEEGIVEATENVKQVAFADMQATGSDDGSSSTKANLPPVKAHPSPSEQNQVCI